MANKCALDAKYNKCPDLRPGQICGREEDNQCSMREPEASIRSDQPREPRWYEQYYDGKSRRVK